MTELLDRVLEAHGGLGRWGEVHSLLARVSMGGLGFFSRLRVAPLDNVEATVSSSWPSIALGDWPRPGQTGYCQPSRAWILDEDGTLVAERCAPGTTFRSLTHWLWWDDLDVLYYCGNIVWQTLCLPFIIAREGCDVRELPPLENDEDRLHRLAVIYPADIPALRRDHVYYADPTGLLRRVEFTPRFAGPALPASQYFGGYETVAGFNCATRHRIYPNVIGGRSGMLGSIGWIDVADVTIAWA